MRTTCSNGSDVGEFAGDHVDAEAVSGLDLEAKHVGEVVGPIRGVGTPGGRESDEENDHPPQCGRGLHEILTLIWAAGLV